jgi:hypothetical protein
LNLSLIVCVCVNVLQGVVYQLDVALESAETQRCGLVFVYDMTGSKYSHFDYELSQKILTLLKVSTVAFFYSTFPFSLRCEPTEKVALAYAMIFKYWNLRIIHY